MKAPWQVLAAPIVAALIWLPWVLWTTLRTYWLSDPDSKFGAEGGVLFVAAIWGAMAVVAAIACLMVQYTWQRIRGPVNTRVLLSWAAGSGVVLSFLSRFLFGLPPLGSDLFGDVGAIVATWLVVCAVLQVAGIAIASAIAT